MPLKRRRQGMKKLLRSGSLSHIALLKPEKQPKDFAFRQRTDSKRAGQQSSRKDCSGVGLETGRFQPAMRQEPI
ncbi:hypothetical protein [Desulfitobacterium sp. PCE1]|uniref:hypothetical protein n=1 Tax=Desulfitobacterium sp. PCE1 TaxID=146907 RepID=UPI00036E6085|nr:hypothetical protein [Desulfitobacterium sp. PCE1]